MATAKHRKVSGKRHGLASAVVLASDAVLGVVTLWDVAYPDAAPMTRLIVRGAASAVRLIARKYRK